MRHPPLWPLSLVLLLQVLATPGGAQLDPARLALAAEDVEDGLPEDATDDCGTSVGTGREELPRDAACVEDLRARGVMSAEANARGVRTPLLVSEVLGVAVRPRGGHATEHDVADCTLIAALARWASALRANGIRVLEHMSMYRDRARVRGTGRPSGHASAMAIDVSHFGFEDGTLFSVEDDWENARRGESPCESHEGESEPQRRVRRVVCEASTSGLFQVVLTPHHDAAHRNHVHLEVRPDVTWRVLE